MVALTLGMILIVVPNLQALRHWLLRLDARLVTSELQTRWLEREKQARTERRAVSRVLSELLPTGASWQPASGEA